MKRAIATVAVRVLLIHRAAMTRIFCVAATRTQPRSAVACSGSQIHSNRLPVAFGVKKEIPYEKQN